MAVQLAPISPRNAQIQAAKRHVAFGLSVISALFASFVSAATESKAVLNKLFEIPFTVVGLICINVFFFQKFDVWGWLTTGLCFIILEAMIADKDDA